jgi:molybdopterin-containing oxidoreductase family membrane subunit
MTLFADKEKLSKIMGMATFCWAILTHGGTGLIFGLIVAREPWFSSLRPFEFIMAALTSSLALLVIVIVLAFKSTQLQARNELVVSLGKLLAGFLCGLLLLIWVGELILGYIPKHAASAFMLGGPFSWLFWVFQVLLGEVIPLFILFHPRLRKKVQGVVTASLLIVMGVFFERFYLVIPGLAYPLSYLPGKIEGVYGAVGFFPLTLVESVISVSMFGFTGFLFILGLKYLELLPAEKGN